MQEEKVGEKSKRKKIFADLTLILALIFVGLSVFLIMELTRKDGAYISVEVDGAEAQVISLSEDGTYVLGDGSNVLVVEGGEAYMKHADCPDGTCIRTGKISRTGEKIVCLPNRVYITVMGADEEMLK